MRQNLKQIQVCSVCDGPIFGSISAKKVSDGVIRYYECKKCFTRLRSKNYGELRAVGKQGCRSVWGDGTVTKEMQVIKGASVYIDGKFVGVAK